MEYSADIMASKTTAKSNGKKDSKRKGKREFAGSGENRVKKILIKAVWWLVRCLEVVT